MNACDDGDAQSARKVLIIVENLPVPFDRRVWHEATTLREAGYQVSVICPVRDDCPEREVVIDGIHIYRHPLPFEARGALGYLLEYSVALFWEFVLSLKVLRRHGFDVIHACNPPDLIFIVGGFYKLFFGKQFVFDHHDINPELYYSKFKRKDMFYKVLCWCERMTFRLADISIATNESYKEIAIERGGMADDSVFVVRSGPKVERMRIQPPVPELKRGKRYLVGYVGVIGAQEGIDYLLDAVDYIVRTKNRHDVHFGLVGGGPELERLKDTCRERGLDDYVTFTGRASDEDLLAMLNTADVCVNPDEFNEMNDKSTMNKVMEYMALAKPIVQFDVREGRFSAQEASLYAKPNDSVDLAEKILGLLDDPQKRAEMGAFGRKRLLDVLAWPHEAPKLLAAYDHMYGLKAADVSAKLAESRS